MSKIGKPAPRAHPRVLENQSSSKAGETAAATSTANVEQMATRPAAEDRMVPSTPAAAMPPGQSAALAQNASSGLQSIGSAVSQPNGTPISNVDEATAFAESRLELAFSDKELSRTDSGVDIQFPRDMWEPKDFKNQSQFKKAIDGVAVFLAQMEQHMGGGADLTVELLPKGELDKRAGSNGDTLLVPMSEGMNSVELREAWDEGSFIRADSWWSPSAHGKKKKLRAVWSLVGNPVGELRSKLRGMLGDSRDEIVSNLRGTLARIGDAPEGSAKSAAAEIVRTYISDQTPSNGPGDTVSENGPSAGSTASSDGATASDSGLRTRLLSSIARMDDKQAVAFLKTWQGIAQDPSFVEEVGNFAATASSNRLVDSTKQFGLINVNTYDAVSVNPDGDLSRHAGDTINDIKFTGSRFGLINVTSVDMVAIVPNLSKIFGGTALERAADRLGLLDD